MLKQNNITKQNTFTQRLKIKVVNKSVTQNDTF